MAAQALQWGTPYELAASGTLGGLAHYYNEQAQALYVVGDVMATRLMRSPEGQYTTPDAQLPIPGGESPAGLRLDHPSMGILHGVWVEDGGLVYGMYVYAADIADIVERGEITEQVDNAIKGLQLSVKNARADLFAMDMSLFAPGAAITLNMAMGDSNPYPMGQYYLDAGPYDPLAQSLSYGGRSRIGRLLRDQTFDLCGSTSQAVFEGTPPDIVEAIILRYGDGELAEADLIIQPHEGEFTAAFSPSDGVLDGLEKWLASFQPPIADEHDTLEYNDTGAEVELAQTLLNNNMPPGQARLVVDGIFGPKTRAAVEDYQRRQGLSVTGDVDAPTWDALLGAENAAGAWELAELYDGRIVVGNAAFVSQYRPVGSYTFAIGQDVLTRQIERSADGAYSRVGVKYQDGGNDAYAYATVGTWPTWAVPAHRTYYADAKEGATQAEAQAQANALAVELQYVGIGEQLVGPIRPELLVGDIAQVDHGDDTATVTGLITEVRHTMGEAGFFTTFSSDSGGAIMQMPTPDNPDPEALTTITAKARKAVAGANRKRRMSDAVHDLATRTIKRYTK